MTKEEQEMWEWLDKDTCSKCGITELPKDYPYHHCELCRK